MQINALEKLGMVDETVAMLEEMEAVGNVTPDAFHLSSAITACGKARRPQQALDLFEAMQTEPLNIKPSRLAYATAIQACANSGWWREAVSLFMKHESDPPKCEDVKNSGKIIEDGPLVGQRIIFNAILDAIAPSTSSHILPSSRAAVMMMVGGRLHRRRLYPHRQPIHSTSSSRSALWPI